jgi:hypothetical protein
MYSAQPISGARPEYNRHRVLVVESRALLICRNSNSLPVQLLFPEDIRAKLLISQCTVHRSDVFELVVIGVSFFGGHVPDRKIKPQPRARKQPTPPPCASHFGTAKLITIHFSVST